MASLTKLAFLVSIGWQPIVGGGHEDERELRPESLVKWVTSVLARETEAGSSSWCGGCSWAV